MNDLNAILDRIRKPLSYASRDNFAHVKRLAAMEHFIQTKVLELRRVMHDHERLNELEQLF